MASAITTPSASGRPYSRVAREDRRESEVVRTSFESGEERLAVERAESQAEMLAR